MKAFRVAAVSAVVLVAALGLAAAQSVSIQAEVLTEWTNLKTMMDKMANEMPDDQYTFKATPQEQTFGERVVHVAQVNTAILRSLGGKATAPPIDAKATTKAGAIKALDDSFDYGTALLKEQTDQTMLQPVANPPQFIGPSSHVRIYTFLIGHTWDIYGQLAVYLRLAGHIPPASQKP